MSADKCAICNRSAYPLESVTVIEKTFHKGCFKCSVCKQALNLKNYKAYDGKIYCFTHCPRPSTQSVITARTPTQAPVVQPAEADEAPSEE